MNGIFQQRGRRSANSGSRPGRRSGYLGVINLLEGYGQDNPASKSQGMKQFMAN